MWRQIAGLLGGAVIGGAVGYSQVLCPNGACVFTGSWYGGAMFGGLLGLMLLGGAGTGSPKTMTEQPPADVSRD